MRCGYCFKKMYSSQEALHHECNDVGRHQKKLTFKRLKGGKSKEAITSCETCGKNVYDWVSHRCEIDVAKTMKDLNAMLKNVGQPDTAGPLAINCAMCGNRFHEEARFRDHFCVKRTVERKRLSIIIHSKREDVSWIHKAAEVHGNNSILYIRGIPGLEEKADTLFRAKGSLIIQARSDGVRRRDMTMIQMSDLVLAFPDKANMTGQKRVETFIKGDGLSVPCHLHPDSAFTEDAWT